MSVVFSYLAKQHWEKNLPKKVKELKASGMYEKELERVGEQASEELAFRVQRGEQYQAAREDVEREYLFLPPETTESPTTD